MRPVDVDESEYFLDLALVKDQVASFEHILQLHDIQGPRLVGVELLENMLDLEVPLPFGLIKKVLLWEAARVTLLQPLQGVVVLQLLRGVKGLSEVGP
jgi:hypothetical protein